MDFTDFRSSKLDYLTCIRRGNMKQKKLVASNGMVLTNGEIYGKMIFLGKGINADDFHEITEEEYQEILNQQEVTVP